MSQWAPNPENLTQTQNDGPQQGSSSGMSEVSSATNAGSQKPLQGPETPVRIPWWVHLFPFLLSAGFFLSAFLVIFAPLPLLFLYFQKGRKWAWLAALTNGAIVGFLGGVVSTLFYLVWVVSLSLSLPELLKRKRSLEFSVVVTLLIMGLTAAFFVAGYSQIHHLNPFVEIQNQISIVVDYLGQSVSVNSGLLSPGDMDEWKKSLLLEFPSALAIFSLVLVWANLILLLRANPNGFRESLGIEPTYIKRWKAPELLVWPTLAAGLFLVVDAGLVSDIALNLFKFFMAIYEIQGLSILSYFFDMWGIRGFFRLVGFSLSVFLMTPLVLSLGFFDLWFDFRGKFRQS